MNKTRIRRHVLTGGPCSGKTSGLAMFTEKLPEYGVMPFIVPEVATLAFTSGVKIADILPNPRLVYRLEKSFLLAQFAFEECWERFAEVQPGANKVLLCDRGAMDVAGYMEQHEFSRLLEELGLTEVDLRDRRYDAVYHTVTAADGAEEFYNLANPARYEKTIEAARIQDKKTLAAWNGHEHFRIIGNHKVVSGKKQLIDFSSKLNWLLREVCLALGIPAPLEIERKFLLAPDAAFPLPTDSVAVDINQTYLTSSRLGYSRRVRERRQGKSVIYFYTEKKSIKPGIRIEETRVIDPREHEMLLVEKDPRRDNVIKRRHSFVWEQQYFQLDVLYMPIPLVLLEAELTDEQQELIMPPFVNVVREVTNDDRYSNSAIAAGRCPGYK